MNKVLVIAVHADDETIGCGGTLLKHKKQGDEIYWMLITEITENHPIYKNKVDLRERDKRNDLIAKNYSFDGVFNLGFPTILLHQIDIHVIISKISEVINRIKPNILYLMSNNDVHSDHRVAFDAVYSCTKSFRYPFIERIYMMETLSETEFAPAVSSKTFIPNVYVDVTEFFEKKMEIVSLYGSEMMSEPYPRSLSSIKALARVRGSRAGVMYAEAFQLLYERR